MCKECGGCCSNFLPLSMKEIAVIKAYIERFNIKPQVNNVAVLDDNCPFLDLTKNKNRCRIYSVRPLICRDYDCKRYAEHKLPSKLFLKDTYFPIDVRNVFFSK